MITERMKEDGKNVYTIVFGFLMEGRGNDSWKLHKQNGLGLRDSRS